MNSSPAFAAVISQLVMMSVSKHCIQQKRSEADKAVALTEFLLGGHTVNKKIIRCINVRLITTSNSQQLTRFAAEMCRSLKWQSPTVR